MRPWLDLKSVEAVYSPQIMKDIPFRERLAVCSWSLQPTSPEDLVSKLDQIGIPRVQLALDPIREHPGLWGSVGETLSRSGYQIVSGMIGFIGEDYSTMQTIMPETI